jgi:hypothetical protein
MLKFCKKCNADTERCNHGKCKPCNKARNAIWREINQEKNREKKSAYYQNTKDRDANKRAKYYQENKDLIKTKAKKHYYSQLREPITFDELKRVLNYDALTGLFTWNISKRGAHKGDQVGSADKNGYIIIRINSKQYKAHRLAWLYMTGGWPKDQIDHVNGIASDNTFSNLRECTSAQNQYNISIKSSNTSGYRGVFFCIRRKKWQARCKDNGKTHNLGYYELPKLASVAYENFAKKLHGEFYRQP